MERKLTTIAEATTQAVNDLTLASRRSRSGTLSVPPHAGIECGDVITLSDPIINAATDYLVTVNQVELDRSKGIYSQDLTLAGAA